MTGPLDLVLVFALLTAPPDAPAPLALLPLAPLTVALALHLEILDARELPWLLQPTLDFAGALRPLRTRWRDLRDAPPLHDGMRFPDHALVGELLSFNRACRQRLDGQLGVSAVRDEELYEAIRETDRLYHLWDTVRDVRCIQYHVSVRRAALKRLRDELLGYPAYCAGLLPPHVPVWRFGKID